MRMRSAESIEVENGRFEGTGNQSAFRIDRISTSLHAPGRCDSQGLEDGEYHALLRLGQTWRLRLVN